MVYITDEFPLLCFEGDKELVISAISKGASDFDGALASACRGGHIEIINLLLEKGAKAMDWGLNGACYGGHLKIALLMIEKGATNINDGLEIACDIGNKELALLMISNGATHWNSGLVFACSSKHKDLILLMLEKGANIDYCSIILNENDIYYLLQKGAKNFGKYDKQAIYLMNHKNIIISILTKSSLYKDTAGLVKGY